MKHKIILALIIILLARYALTGNAQDQTGFISIDCGLQSNASYYNESTTGLTYIPDKGFVETGESRMIGEKYRQPIQQQFWSLRSFPEGDRNCYKIDVAQGSKYLVRAAFLYGDHDGQGIPPTFDLYLGPHLWDSIKIKDSSTDMTKEFIHVMATNYIHVCLVNTGQGVPFVSTIELRPLDGSGYQTQFGSLKLFVRRDLGSTKGYRYGTGKDVHDRLWPSMFVVNDWESLNTSKAIDFEADPNDHFSIPSIIMCTAAVPKDPEASLNIVWTDSNTSLSQYVTFFHFAEIEQLKANESREFNILYNDKFLHGPVSLSYLRTTTVSTPTPFSGSKLNFSIARTEKSTHPSILNAFETYIVMDFPHSESSQQDGIPTVELVCDLAFLNNNKISLFYEKHIVDAIMRIKSSSGLSRNWQGDPCSPKNYSWEGLTCIYDGTPRIVSLNLSASKLTGEIPSSIANLSMIQELDLSNNNFTGSVPDFLSKLPNLRILNLENNQLNGSVPFELLQKHDKGSLSLSVNGNTNLCTSVSCTKKKSASLSVVAFILIAAGSLVFILLVSVVWWALRRNRQRGEAKFKDREYSEESRKRKFSFSEIKKMTNNFEKVIGKGAFGMVYHGRAGDAQVAVKLLSPTAVKGYQQFQAEVNILLRVYHRNLTTLVGYFNDDNHSGLVYEFMANGDLQSHLSVHADKKDPALAVLTWEERLKIAIDAGQGLEYLHHGCKPPIVHRDIKPANILLNDNFQAKLSDFGISKTFPTDSNAAYVSTVVAGTPGYLDPEYYKSNRLNEKSDVYSFGVLLLEIITGRPAISKDMCIGEWVSLMIEKGLIDRVVDPRLQGKFNVNSAWKVVETAINCVNLSSVDRPNMGEVVGELKVCFQMTQSTEARDRGLRGLSDSIPLNLNTDHVITQPSTR